MKQFMTVLTALALVALVGCQSPVLSAKMTAGTGAASGDPVGGLTVRLATTPADTVASRTGARAITGVTKLVVSLESAQYASQVASASEVAGTFTLSFATVKPGRWTVKASLLDASDVEKYFGQVDTTVQPGVANSVSLAVSATGNIGLTITENTTLSMVSIPGGSFHNGTATMTVSDFQMSQTEVTQAQYQAVTGVNPSHFTTDPNLPVETVTWYDAVEFCNKLSTLEGLTPVYTITDRTPAAGYPISGATVVPDYTVNGYRLPSEAEWEYACRAGTTTTYYWGNEIFNSYLWHYENSGSTTHPVKMKLANSWGLYDMSGNVAEWCEDWYAPYQAGTTSDYLGPKLGTYRIVRGGYILSSDILPLRSEYRTTWEPSSKRSGYGFRVVKRSAADTVAALATAKTALNVGLVVNDSLSSVSSNVNLPSAGYLGTSITWVSSNTAIVALDGTLGGQNGDLVTLTATLTLGGLVDSKTFHLTIAYPLGKAGPAGGLVFYKKADASEGWQFLEAAPGDQSTGVKWNNNISSAIEGADGTTVGTGKSNTSAIVAAQGANAYAATLCEDLVVGVYNDWFLPSKDELNAMYINLKYKGLGSLSGNDYWSSSQSGSSNAYAQTFWNGSQFNYNYLNYSYYSVRAIRAF